MEGRQEGQVEGLRSAITTLAERHGPLAADLAARLAACADPARLRAVVVALASTPDDPAAVRASLERLGPAAT